MFDISVWIKFCVRFVRFWVWGEGWIRIRLLRIFGLFWVWVGYRGVFFVGC